MDITDRLQARRLRKKKRSTIFLERTRKGHRQSGEHRNCFKGHAGDASARGGGAQMGFSKRTETSLNLTELSLGLSISLSASPPPPSLSLCLSVHVSLSQPLSVCLSPPKICLSLPLCLLSICCIRSVAWRSIWLRVCALVSCAINKCPPGAQTS